MSIYDGISPTAKSVAYIRSFSGIPYTKEIARLCGAKKAAVEIFGGKDGFENPLVLARLRALIIECRYKSITNVILSRGIVQVLELASGVSPRGLILSKAPPMTYVETDLPGILSEKKKLVKHFLKKENRLGKSKLYLEEANALSLSQLQKACRHFSKDKPVAVVIEGLMSYLTMNEQRKVLQNVRKILGKYGGAWITTDFSTERSLKEGFGKDESDNEKFMKSLDKLAGNNRDKNRFESETQVAHFIRDNGFRIISKNPENKGIKIVSAKILHIKAEQLKRTVYPKIYVMVLAKPGKGI